MISLLVHMLAFGSAFAYAYYSGDMFTRTFDYTTVSLVELGNEENIAKSRMKRPVENAECRARSPEGTCAPKTIGASRKDKKTEETKMHSFRFIFLFIFRSL